MTKQQITVDFEEELKKAFESDSSRKLREDVNKHDIEVFKDFGMGKATTKYNPMYVMNGILF